MTERKLPFFRVNKHGDGWLVCTTLPPSGSGARFVVHGTREEAEEAGRAATSGLVPVSDDVAELQGWQLGGGIDPERVPAALRAPGALLRTPEEQETRERFAALCPQLAGYVLDQAPTLAHAEAAVVRAIEADEFNPDTLIAYQKRKRAAAAKPATTAKTAASPKSPSAPRAQKDPPTMSDIASKLAGILADLPGEQLESVVTDARRRRAAKGASAHAPDPRVPRVEDIDPVIARAMGLLPAEHHSTDVVHYCVPSSLPKAR
jgi:hypothetical protein